MSPFLMRRLQPMATYASSMSPAKPICTRENSLLRSSYLSRFAGACCKRPNLSLNPDASPAPLRAVRSAPVAWFGQAALS